MFKCFNKIRINYNILASVLILMMFSMTYLGLSIQNYALASLPCEIRNEMKSENSEINFYSLVPTNISVMPESLPAGNSYLSPIFSNGTATYTRNLTDELFPFQLDRIGSPMSRPTTEVAAAVLGDTIYIICGYDEGG